MFSLYPLKLSEGKKRKILKVREELRLGTCQSTFFLLLAPLPSPTATAPHYASQNRRIYFCSLFKNIKILWPIVFIFGIFSPVEALWGEKKGKFWKFEKSFGSEHVSPLFFCFWRRCRRQLLPRHIMPRRTEEYFFAFVQKYQDITTHGFHFWHFLPVEVLREKKRKF